MANPPTLSRPPSRGEVIGPDGKFQPWWQQWLIDLFFRVGSETGETIIGEVEYFETDIDQADLASSGTVTLIDASSGEQWKIREIVLSGEGTDFSGGSGDRLLSVSDGTSTWTVIPAATLQSLAFARWGDAGVPAPATAAHLTTASASGTDVTAQYSGGSNDYTAGECTLIILAERVA